MSVNRKQLGVKWRWTIVTMFYALATTISLERQIMISTMFRHSGIRLVGVSAFSSSSSSSNRRESSRSTMPGNDPRPCTFQTCRGFSTSSSSSSSLSSTSTSTSAASFSDEALGEARRQLRHALDLYELNRKATPLHLDQLVSDLETESSEPTFWDADNKDRNTHVTAQISQYTRLQTRLSNWDTWKGDAQVALEMLQEDGALAQGEEQAAMLDELQTAVKLLLEDNERYQLELLLSGPYDDQPCRILLTAGAGGTEANDWVADLRRMYERHAEQMGFSVVVEDSQPGDVVGFKSVELVLSGGPGHPYGWFKSEKGAHRLVRLSPFNANNKRQTTFAGVDVAPILMDETSLQSIEIPDKDMQITTMRSGGAGGQNVNKVSSAVRIKHLPSGLQVKCTQERSQAMNRELALKRLKGQLLAIAKEQRVQEIKDIRGDQVEASWGAQIRNYVLHPYKLVKDQRTNWETSDTQGFLDGNLEDCIAGLLRHRAKQEQDASLQEQQEPAGT